MLLTILREYLKEGQVTQNSAMLALLIEDGVKTVSSLAKAVCKSEKTVKRQLDELTKLGLVISKNGLLITRTKMSLDLDDLNISNNNIDSRSEDKNAIDSALAEVAQMFNIHITKVEQAIRNANVDLTKEDILEAAKITIERRPRSVLGYFVTILRDVASRNSLYSEDPSLAPKINSVKENLNPKEQKISGEEEKVKEPEPVTWQSILDRLKSKLSDYSYKFLIKRMSPYEQDNQLMIKCDPSIQKSPAIKQISHILEPLGVPILNTVV